MEGLEQLQSSLGGVYTIERELGGGGMSRVFIAKEFALGRNVVLKILPRELTGEVSTERFRREIQLAAGLHHPHIVPVLSAGDAEGVLYYTMPLVEGETLRALIARGGALPASRVVPILRDVAKALAHAHRKGIVHRDIKPENILLSGDAAAVTDFGIAKAVSVARGGDLTLTQTGTSLGTPLYMSPEQASGDPAADHRADLYAFGCVAYELLAGRPPFTAATSHALIAAHLRDRPEPILNHAPSAPAALADLVMRCLEKEPSRRPSSAEDVLAALDQAYASAGSFRWFSAPHVKASAVAAFALVAAGSAWWYSGRNSSGVALDSNVIAVFPFRVTAPDSSLNYLREAVIDLHNAVLTGDGLPRAIDTRTMLNAYKRAVSEAGGDLTVPQAIEVARSLGARRALVGEVVATRAGMTMNARLLSVPAANVLASHSESGTGDELVLTRRLAARLLAKSIGEAIGRLPGLSDSVEAVKAYLAGLQAARSGNNRSAFDHLGRALEIDSTFAAAALWRARVGWGAFVFGNPPIRRADSVAWSLRARLSARDRLILESRPTIGPKWPAPSTVTDILEALERAARANPDRPEVLTDWAAYLLAFGQHAGVEPRVELERATMLLDSALALDSAFVPALSRRLFVALERRDTAAVRYFYRRLRNQTDSLYRPHVSLAVARALGDTAQLDQLVSRVSERWGPTFDAYLWSTYHGYSTVRDAQRAAALLQQRSAAPAEDRQRAAGALISLAAIRGQTRRALALPETLGIEQPLGGWIPLAISDAGYDDVANTFVPILEARAESLLTARSEDNQIVAGNRQLAAQQLCIAQLWRVATGDTMTTRRAIRKMRDVVRTLDLGQAYRVGPMELCPLLLEAALERRPGRVGSPARDRVESLIRRGVWEVPGNVANLILARWHEEDGDYKGALQMVRRTDPMSMNVAHPTLWRMRGRLAALVGDTAKAIHAYTRYLEIRDLPEPGPMADEVRAVRRHLAQLTGEGHRGQRLR